MGGGGGAQPAVQGGERPQEVDLGAGDLAGRWDHEPPRRGTPAALQAGRGEGGRRGPRADASERTAAGCVRGSAWPPKVRTAALARASVEGKGPKGRGRRQSRVRTRRGPERCF